MVMRQPAFMASPRVEKPVRVVAFNTAEGWSRDVSEDVAWEVANRAGAQGDKLPTATHDFVAFLIGEHAAPSRP